MFYLTQLGVEKDSQIDVKFMAFGGGLIGHNDSFSYNNIVEGTTDPKIEFCLSKKQVLSLHVS